MTCGGPATAKRSPGITCRQDRIPTSRRWTLLQVSPTAVRPSYAALVETKKAARIGGSSCRLRDPGYWLVGVDTRKEQSLEDAQRIMLGRSTLPARPVTAAEVDPRRRPF